MLSETATFEQIAASLAHEVKNPLSLVRANIDLLELDDDNKLYEKNYRIMRREIDRVNALLLDFIQIADPSEISPEHICIVQMLRELCDSLSTSYYGKIGFYFSYDKALTISADERKLRQVFYNIIKNCVESIEVEHGSGFSNGLVEIAIHEQGDFLKIIISDNGGGITDESLQKIRQPFYTTKSGGSGLGLYFCKSVIARHGGTFEITNKPCGNNGCAVTITLPYQAT